MAGFYTIMKTIFTCWGVCGSRRRRRRRSGEGAADGEDYANNDEKLNPVQSSTDPAEEHELEDNGFYILPAIIYFILTGALASGLVWFIMTKYLALFGIKVPSGIVYSTMGISGFVVGALSGVLLHVRAFVMLSIPMILSARGRAILLATCLALTIAGPMQESIVNAKSGANVIRCLATGAQRTAVRGFEAQVDVINGTISQYNYNVLGPNWSKPKRKPTPEEEENGGGVYEGGFLKALRDNTLLVVNMSKTSEAVERRINATKASADMFRDEVQQKFDTMNLYVKRAVQICACVPLLTLVFQLVASANYLFRYLSRDAFDNVYITRDLRMLDQKNRMFVARHPKVIVQRGPYEALPVFPLRRHERREHIDLRACRITRTELRSIGRSIFTVAPYLLFFIVACLLTAGSYFVIVIIRDAAVNSFVAQQQPSHQPRNCSAEAAAGANSTLWRELAPDMIGNSVLINKISSKLVGAQCRTDEMMKGLLQECTSMLMTSCDDEEKLSAMTTFGKSKTLSRLKTKPSNKTDNATTTTTTAAPVTSQISLGDSAANNTARKCVANPYALRAPDIENIILIAAIFFVIIAACLCNGFTLRLRRVICKFYYPERERRRTRYLFRKLKLNRKIEAEKLKIAAYQTLEELKLHAKREGLYNIEPANGKFGTIRSQASLGTIDGGVYDFDPERAGGGVFSSDDSDDTEENIYNSRASSNIRPKKCLACRNKRKLFQFRRRDKLSRHSAIKNKLLTNHSSAGGFFSTRVFHCTTQRCAGTFCQKCIDRMAYVCPFCERKFTESVVNKAATLGTLPTSGTTTSFGNNPPPRRGGSGPPPLPPGPPPPRVRQPGASGQFQRQESTPSDRYRHNAHTNLGMADSESNLEMYATQHNQHHQQQQMSKSAKNLERIVGFHPTVLEDDYDESKTRMGNSNSTPDVLLVRSKSIGNADECVRADETDNNWENGQKISSVSRSGKMRPPPPPPENPGWKKEIAAKAAMANAAAAAAAAEAKQDEQKTVSDETDDENDPIYEEPPGFVVDGKVVFSRNVNPKPAVPPRLPSTSSNPT